MIVVTGSNGFIGSNLIRNLNTLGISDILAVDNHDNKELKKKRKGLSNKGATRHKRFLRKYKERTNKPF